MARSREKDDPAADAVRSVVAAGGTMRGRNKFATIGCGGLALLVPLILMLFWLTGSTVPEGHRGVLLTWGRAHEGVLEPGFHLTIPLVQRIVPVDVRVTAHNFREIDAASREYQAVKLTGAMNYHLLADRADDIYRTVGLDFDDKVIDPAFADFIKEIVPTYSIIEILPKREEIRQRTKDALNTNLMRYGIVVDDVYLSNIRFSPEYEAVIEQKQVTQQQVEREQQILFQKRVQAQQAEAEAEGQARAQVARARGEAEANQAITQSVTPQLIDYLRWTRWDGKLPLVTGDSQPLIQVPNTRDAGSPAQPGGAAQPGGSAQPAAPAQR